MIRATILKDVWLLLRDRGRLMMLFAMPIVFMLVFGSMFKAGPNNGEPRPIAIWHAAGDAHEILLAQELGLAAGRFVRHRPYFIQLLGNAFR